MGDNNLKKEEIFDCISKFFDKTSKDMRINIRMVDRDPFPLTVKRTYTVWYIKEKIRKLVELPADFYLIYGVKKLECSGHNKLQPILSDYHIQKGDSLRLVLRIGKLVR